WHAREVAHFRFRKAMVFPIYRMLRCSSLYRHCGTYKQTRMVTGHVSFCPLLPEKFHYLFLLKKQRECPQGLPGYLLPYLPKDRDTDREIRSPQVFPDFRYRALPEPGKHNRLPPLPAVAYPAIHFLLLRHRTMLYLFPEPLYRPERD